jgi:hypothetical protein
VGLGIELEADALLSLSGAQAYSIALKRGEEASSQVGSPAISARRLVGMIMKK